jgi:hypothetical protein
MGKLIIIMGIFLQDTLLGWFFLFFMVVMWGIMLYVLISNVIPYFMGIMDNSDRFYRYMKRGNKKVKNLVLFIVLGFILLITFRYVRLDLKSENSIISSNKDIDTILHEVRETHKAVDFQYSPTELIIIQLRKELEECQKNK